MKKFFQEFKKFITRGNVIDMAVGVIVGSSFTAIVNGLSNYVLKPIINWLLALIFGADTLSEIFTILKRADDADGAIDLANSIYIDWGAFINAIINFFLIAFVPFSIVKLVNHLRESQDKLEATIKKGKLTKEQRKQLKAAGIKLTDKEAVSAFLAEMKKKDEEAKAAAAAEAAEKARLEREANPTTEDLLKAILAELKKD